MNKGVRPTRRAASLGISPLIRSLRLKPHPEGGFFREVIERLTS
jgi:predicted cupin superfamily sugar epimerase